jgi:hypothetical protein
MLALIAKNIMVNKCKVLFALVISFHEMKKFLTLEYDCMQKYCTLEEKNHTYYL